MSAPSRVHKAFERGLIPPEMRAEWLNPAVARSVKGLELQGEVASASASATALGRRWIEMYRILAWYQVGG